ncbi:ComF family protein [Pseudoalteromonas sp. Cnat2-41]|uniref:ComF family protein n=1 Tax=unclassified Pseudoalteromonas TaxID=194690 RepID=UPI001EF7F060|nr:MULTISPECIES: ComF family protein [unclassified Pseudoalteromonas]MCF2862514.1 ComF family protein [Pseudoalteromonas sp. CNAT2-18]MCG7559034.1 ComF family protein [Pseudoalteromonas sp. CNAT2-18.1]
MDALSHLRSWLFPQYCKLCSQSLPIGAQLCQHCCATFSTFTEPDLLVRADIQRLFPLRYVDHLVALQWYRPPVSTWLKQYKYAHQLHYQVAVSQLLQQHLYTLSRADNWQWPDSIVPIPLAHPRLVWRGFNQCVLLWQQAVPQGLFVANALARPLSTKQQAKLGARSRRKNLANAFTVRMRVQGMHIAIVDDVMTTGATVDNAARKLKDAGAKEVSAWVVCLTAK